MSEGAFPTRPTIPPTLWWAAALWAGAAAGESVAWRAWIGQNTVWAAAAVVMPCRAAAVYAMALHRHARQAAVTAVVVLLASGVLTGFGVSILQGAQWRSVARLLEDAGAREWEGVVVADPREGRFGPSMRVRVQGAPYQGALLTVYLPGGSAAPELGRRVRFSAIPEPREPDERSRRAARTGEHATANAWRCTDLGWRAGVPGGLYRWRAEAARRLEVVPGEPGALLRGIVLGDRRLLDGTAVDEDFRVLGLSHVVAVSGSHLAVVCALVLVLGHATGAPRKLVVAVVVAVACAYTVLSGLALSAIRSCVMLTAGALAGSAGVRQDGVSALALGVSAMVLWQPWSVFDVGFALSVAAVGGLLVFGDLGVAWVREALPHALGKPATLVGTSLVAQVSTLPIVTSTFGMLSLAAPVANVAIVPAGEAALCVGLAGAAIGGVWPQLGTVAIRLAGALLGYACEAASLLARMPAAAVSMGGLGAVWTAIGVAGVVALWAWWPRPSRTYARAALGAVLLVTVLVAVGPRGPATCRVVVMDVGQGDAILVQDGEHSMLVDTGADAGVLRQALARNGVRRLDSVILTHDHDDHTGGFDGLVGVVRVGWVGRPDVAEAGFDRVRETIPRISPRGKVRMRELAAGQSWPLGDSVVRVLWPPSEASGLSTNDTSVVLEVQSGSVEVVLTGDAEQSAQTGMAEAGTLRRVEVLKVPHHGSTNGLGQEGCREWSPRVAIISVGAGNDFGHPASSTLDMLRRQGVRIYRTDVNGDVVVEVTHRGFRVRSTKPRSAVGCATMVTPPTPRITGSRVSALTACEETDASLERRQPEARLSDPWQRGAAVGARAPPAEGHGRLRGR
ncbi:MAG: DNA internalization-related competence protein ComEC/Rec2 [Coriobacteriales bacterium]